MKTLFHIPSIFSFSLLFVLVQTGRSQVCPPNIDFESGSFSGWQCYTGFVSASTGTNIISLSPSGPIPERHTMYTAGNFNGVDPYGGFPVLCPNGSGHSIRLGNAFGGGQAEGISYEFTIPATEDRYNLIYNYAVVFQDPSHQIFQQPRMEIEVMNMTDNILIECSSFTFIPFGSVLPGFFQSPNPGTPTPVWCKDWTAVTINLDGHAGKTIRLSFKTADCTFTRHFGYAYIDVNTECSGTFLGATFCPDDTAVNVVAPYGYQKYTWYDSTLANVIGTEQILRMEPPPPPGTVIAVKVEPYSGYGCEQMLYARLVDTLTVVASAGPDLLSCNEEAVQLGRPPQPGIVYEWQPSAGLSKSDVSNPWASPATTTAYILTAKNSGGGCKTKDTVIVRASRLDDSIAMAGKTLFCMDSDDSAVLQVNAASFIQWYRNQAILAGATKPVLSVRDSGSYHAVLRNADGCTVQTEAINVFVEKPRAGIRYPVQWAVQDIAAVLEARDFGKTYLWKPALNLNNPSLVKPVFQGKKDQLYTVEITTEAGCVTIDTLLVRVVKNVNIAVPSAFTPNKDGLNDYLSPVLMGVKQLRYFRVYNRWGQLLYESNKESPGWDGRIGGVLQPTGVVVWVAEGLGVDGKVYVKKGTSLLIR